ncbi:MAG: metal-dependent transcriptional regulator [Candidatus Saliniplasma sp.]
MKKNSLTKRDRKYVRAIYLKEGFKRPVGPSELAEDMKVSRVGALQKMKRLEGQGLGEYMSKEGLILNSDGVDIVEEDIKRHHLLEKFLQEALGMGFEEACEESSRLGSVVSKEMIERIGKNYREYLECECGLCLKPPYEIGDLKECHWIKRQFRDGGD